MITSLVYTDDLGREYDLPHNNLKLCSFFKNKASSLDVSVVDSSFYPSNGNKISFFIENELVFTGKIFSHTKSYDIVTFTAFDNLFYFKSSDTIIFKSMTASQILNQICIKNNLSTTDIAYTSYVLPYHFYENMSYFEILDDVLSNTSLISGVDFQIFDKNGDISLKTCDFNTINFEITDDILIDIFKSTDISNLYNNVHVYQIKKNGYISNFYAKNSKSIEDIGVITKTLKVDRELTTAQCNLIAQNTLLQGDINLFSIEIEIIATNKICVGDVLLMNKIKYYVFSQILNISPEQDTYTLTLIHGGY